MAGAVLAGSGGRAASPGRPNILWLVSEDNNPWIGAYGDRLAHTPAIDALAARGITWRNVYSVSPVCAPSRFALLTGAYPQSFAPAQHMRAIGHVPKEIATYPQLMRAAGYRCTNNAKTDYNCDIDPAAIWDASGPAAHWRDTPTRQPFFAVFNDGTTHESSTFAPVAGRVRPEDVRIPANLPDTPGMRSVAAGYHNLIERMDGNVAKRLRELDEAGLSDDTIVFYYSDNGGILPRSKRYCYDEGLRCALVVHAPPKWAHMLPAEPGSTIDTPATLMDLGPTVLSLAGVSAPAHMAGRPVLGRDAVRGKRLAFGGRGRMDENIDMVRTVTDGRWRYIRNYMPHRPAGMHGAYEWLAASYQEYERGWRAGTLTVGQARFFRPRDFEELYDLSTDPAQIDNLAGRAETRAVQQRLSSALDAQMVAIHDNGFVPEGMAGEGWVKSRDRRIYPLDRVMRLAQQAAGGEMRDLPTVVAALDDPNSILRYWAATGILVRGSAAAAHAPRVAQMMVDDTEPLVRVVACEASAGLGQGEEAVRRLADLAGAGQSWQVRLAALNALAALGPAAAPALPAIDAAATSDQEYLVNKGRYLAAVLRGTYAPEYPVFPVEKMHNPPPARETGGRA
ncbi:MAG TPA: sulfatase-like hydrolase/transferase [Sphingomonas sp.]|nr:sulfatase-like hydrolase/transferase [Sphingomonas sp.]